MRKVLMSSLALTSLIAMGTVTSQTATAGTSQDKLDAASLKTMVEGLGYETKPLSEEAGKEKYEIKVTKGGFNIPVGAEISPSTNYIWLTVSLGDFKPGHKSEEFLKQNAKIQPSFFYITSKGILMMALPLDNRLVSAAILKRNLEKITQDVSDSSSLWQLP